MKNIKLFLISISAFFFNYSHCADVITESPQQVRQHITTLTNSARQARQHIEDRDFDTAISSLEDSLRSIGHPEYIREEEDSEAPDEPSDPDDYSEMQAGPDKENASAKLTLHLFMLATSGCAYSLKQIPFANNNLDDSEKVLDECTKSFAIMFASEFLNSILYKQAPTEELQPIFTDFFSLYPDEQETADHIMHQQDIAI